MTKEEANKKMLELAEELKGLTIRICDKLKGIAQIIKDNSKQ